jgi:lysophospholipase L1-like esterase
MSYSGAGVAFLASWIPLALAAAADDQPGHSPTRPAERLTLKFWRDRHEKFLDRARRGGVDVLFLGDAITQRWETDGKESWARCFEPLHAANFGINSDRTENVLWRITEGKELEGISPRVAVLLIGTNNVPTKNTPEEIAEGIAAIVKELRRQKPDMQVLVLGLLPRSPRASDRVRDKIKQVNDRIAKLEDGKRVHYLDVGDRFLAANGNLSKDIMPDSLHPGARGYQVLAEALLPAIEDLLKK